MDVDALIGWNFKRLRIAQGLSQGELSLRLGRTAQGYLSQLEDGQRNPTGRTIFKLAAALGVEAGELFVAKEDLPEHISNGENKKGKSRAGRAPAKPKKNRKKVP